MKRIKAFTTSILSIGMMAFATFSLVSCYQDDPYYDDYNDNWYSNYNWYTDPYDYNQWNGDNTDVLKEEASFLCHQWTGSLVYYYTDDAGKSASAQMNVKITFDRYDAYSVNGKGEEIDADDAGNTQTLYFTWYIDPQTENIYMKYTKSEAIFVFDESRSDEYGFKLDSNQFAGWALGKNHTDEALNIELTRSLAAKKSTTVTSQAKSSIPMKLVAR